MVVLVNISSNGTTQIHSKSGKCTMLEVQLQAWKCPRTTQSTAVVHLKDALLDRQERHIKRAAAQVKNQHVALARRRALFVQAVRDSSSRGLVDNPHYVQPRNHA